MIASDDSGFAASRFDVVLIAASTGGLRVLVPLVAALPAQFPAAILLVQHRDPVHQHLLAHLLRRHATIDVQDARAGDAVQPGRLAVMPVDQQLVLVGGDPPRLARVSQPGHATADTLFRSAALIGDDRVIGVVLTGALHDGAAGVQAIKVAGGRVVVQDPREAEKASMPRAAIETGVVDLVLPARSIAPALIALVTVPGAADLFRVPVAPWAPFSPSFGR